jgi:sugar fermentation stimulation protein A
MLLALPPLASAAVEARPSKTLKSPYVADVCIATEDSSIKERKGLCHSPGLGCSGLVACGRSIWVSAATGAGAKTQWTARLAQCADSEGPFLVGIHPLDCQKAAAELLDSLLTFGQGTARWASEVCIDAHTRLDYVGTLEDNKKVYVEVKTAMISHETAKPRAERRAIFPEGFRRSAKDTVSPRAVKHCETLAALLERPDTAASILLFVVPRTDCEAGLQLNPADPIYCAAVREAVRKGVEVRVVGLKPTLVGLEFSRELPFILPTP